MDLDITVATNERFLQDVFVTASCRVWCCLQLQVQPQIQAQVLHLCWPNAPVR